MHSDDAFQTIGTPGEGSYTEKRSRFLSFAMHVESEEEAKERVAEIRKKFYDARHVCYAYSLGADRGRTRTNDDGEPSGTAGKPILGQLLAFDVTDTLAVVVRYFGGVKLGTGGLTMAYKTAAAEALRNAEVVEKIIYASLSVEASYANVDMVMRLAHEKGARIAQQTYTDTGCVLTLSIRRGHYDDLRNCVAKLYTLRILPETD